ADDVAGAGKFFRKRVGLATEDEVGDASRQSTPRTGTMWGLVSRPPHASPLSGELSLEVDDVDEAYRVWKGRGVETVTEPSNQPFGRTFAFKDADGRVLHAWAHA